MPKFNTGGTYALSSDDLAAFYAWQLETDELLKRYGYYYYRDSDGIAYGTMQVLGVDNPNANVLAAVILEAPPVRLGESGLMPAAAAIKLVNRLMP